MNNDYPTILSQLDTDWIETHEWLNDQVFDCHILPFSNVEKFQFSLERQNRPQSEFIINFDANKEILYIISMEDRAVCQLALSPTFLKFHLQKISLQRFVDRLIHFGVKKKSTYLTEHVKAVTNGLILNTIEDTREGRDLIDLLIDLRYAAIQSFKVYNQLKDVKLTM